MVHNYDFVIVGGGMNGVNLATHFLRKGVPTNKIRIIDRQKAPISLWFEMTRQVGMEQARSPIHHHLGGKEDSLDTFISIKRCTANSYDPTDPHRRPSLQAFNEYLRNLIAKYRVDNIFQQGSVVGARPKADGGFVVSYKKLTEEEEVESGHTNHLILAVGYHDNRYIPAWNQLIKVEDFLIDRDLQQRIRWIQELKAAGAKVHHIYEPEFDVDKVSKCDSIIVVGGGFSGVQLALKLIEKNIVTKVTLLVEYPIEVHYFDADPAWAEFSSDEMHGFLRKNLAERRSTIQAARNQGSISPELKQKLDQAIEARKIHLVLGDTKTAHYQDSKIILYVNLKDSNNCQGVSAGQVILATGYRLNTRPGGPWLDNLEKDLRLPTHDCYPVLNDKTLQWGTQQLFVAGQLAELSLGPLARNIAGTQLSASRITNAPSIRSTIQNYKGNVKSDMCFSQSRSRKNFKKTILVTGGNGYIGSIFVDYYAKRHPNHRVIVVVRTKRPRIQFPENVHIVQSDYGDQEKIEQIIREYQVTQVLHLAAELDKDGSKTNVTKSAALFKAMDNTGVSRIVYSSSFMVYHSPVRSDGKLDEESSARPPSTENYAESKRVVENMILERKEWQSAILRYSIAIGTSADHGLGDVRQNQGILSTYLEAAYHSSAFNMPDNGSAQRDFVDVQDIASATDKALMWVRQRKNPSALVLNVGTGRPHSINQLIRVIELVTGKLVQVKRGSDSPNVPVSFLDISLIRKTLQWEPRVTFEESISNAWRFFTESKAD